MGGGRRSRRRIRHEEEMKKQVYEISGVLMVVSNNMGMDHNDHCDSFSSDNVHAGEAPSLFTFLV
jgi:hypothetical protein